MVGYLYPTQQHRLRLRPELMAFHGLKVLGVALPGGGRAPDRGAKALARAGCRRVLLHPELKGPEVLGALLRRGLTPVDPLPLYFALASRLVLALVESLPLRRRRVALRGEEAGAGWALASALCPQVGTLLLDFDRGEEALALRLRRTWGAAALHLGQGLPPQASVELSPREEPAGTALRLWGEGDLAGLTLAAGEVADPSALALLWESGRVSLEDIRLCGGNSLDSPGKKPYNIGTI